jgi:hypothetical protein
MAAVAHNPAFAKKVGIPQSVGKDFNNADKGRKFGKGGTMATKKKMDPKMMAALMSARQPAMPPAAAAAPAPMGGMGGMRKGGTAMKKMAKGGMASDAKEDMKMDKKQDKAMIKKALKMHDAQEHKGGKGTDLSKLKKGGMAMKKMAMGGMAKESMGPKNMSKDVEKGSNTKLKHGEHGVQKKGHTRAMMPKMKGRTV